MGFLAGRIPTGRRSAGPSALVGTSGGERGATAAAAAVAVAAARGETDLPCLANGNLLHDQTPPPGMRSVRALGRACGRSEGGGNQWCERGGPEMQARSPSAGATTGCRQLASSMMCALTSGSDGRGGLHRPTCPSRGASGAGKYCPNGRRSSGITRRRPYRRAANGREAPPGCRVGPRETAAAGALPAMRPALQRVVRSWQPPPSRPRPAGARRPCPGCGRRR